MQRRGEPREGADFLTLQITVHHLMPAPCLPRGLFLQSAVWRL